jgi:hypothetical protein
VARTAERPAESPAARIPAQPADTHPQVGAPAVPAALPVHAETAAEWADLAAAAAPAPAAPPVEQRTRPTAPAAAAPPRSSLASEALTELSRLSSYAPSSVQDEGKVSLRRRTPAPVPAEPEPGLDPDLAEVGQRARTAANVRSMLAGFKAGVERGRTSPSANRPAPRLGDHVPSQRNVPEGGDA